MIPLKFILYQVACILLIILQFIFLFYIGCRVAFFNDIHFDGGIIAAFILLIDFGLFFGNNFLGLRLYKKLLTTADISKRELNTLKVFFFIQVFVQVFTVIAQVFHINDLLRKIQRMSFYSQREFYDYLLFDILPLLITLLTFYYEAFTFPLVNAVKKKYEASQNDLDSIGEDLISSSI